MDKLDFLECLKDKLSGLPREDADHYVEYYSEMIDDRIEDGMSEEEAVADIGSVDEIVEEILRTTPLVKLVKEKVKPKRKLRAWEIVLLAVGSPLWFSLGLAAFCVLLAVYIVLWALVIVLICVDVAFFAVAAALFAVGTGCAVSLHLPEAAMCIGAGLVMCGLALLLSLGVKGTVKGTALLSKKIILGIKSCFVRKGDS